MTDTPSNRKQSSVRRANVTACQRCKSRKQRCDQNIPACSSCARAGVPCYPGQMMYNTEGSAYHTLLDTVTVPDTIKFLPRPTAIQLTAIYFEHSNFFSPVLNQKSFHDTIAILYQDQTSSDQGTSVQKFQLCMVLAIAIRLLNDCIRLVLRVSYWNTHRKATTEHLPQRLTHDSCLSFITISPLSSSFGRRAERSRAVSF
ncbi:hypothetical protein H9Q74_012387 [Fusarium xylarioides]|nr:hypothetical protein H9Q71_012317 [Fusarium xylarioides]KAG5814106.1 hypothetical protein H9Q74_012387 [Fusarium xylarioides]